MTSDQCAAVMDSLLKNLLSTASWPEEYAHLRCPAIFWKLAYDETSKQLTLSFVPSESVYVPRDSST